MVGGVASNARALPQSANADSPLSEGAKMIHRIAVYPADGSMPRHYGVLCEGALQLQHSHHLIAVNNARLHEAQGGSMAVQPVTGVASMMLSPLEETKSS